MLSALSVTNESLVMLSSLGHRTYSFCLIKNPRIYDYTNIFRILCGTCRDLKESSTYPEYLYVVWLH